VVDDEAGFTELLKMNLEEVGDYEVHVENDATRAAQTALWFDPHVVLMDMIMPDMSGHEAADRMRSHRGLEQVPVIFLTASLSREDVPAPQSSIRGFPLLSKPATLEEITAAIDRHALS
jgi:CheY-like chemotaxis protein